MPDTELLLWIFGERRLMAVEIRGKDGFEGLSKRN
jgi:hypothetical protein